MANAPAGGTPPPERRPHRPHRPRRSAARLRILGWIISLAALAIAGNLLLQRRFLIEQLDRDITVSMDQEIGELRLLADGRDPATGEPFDGDVAAIFSTFLQREVPGQGEAFYLYVDGEFFNATVAPVRLDHIPEIDQRWSALTESERGRFDTEAGEVRWVGVPLTAGDGQVAGTFVVATFVRGQQQEINDAIRTGALVGVGMLGAAVVVGWVVAGRILRPVRAITETAQRITETDLDRRIPVEGDDELAELGRTFNDMLDRLQAAFAAQRAFVDDAGHELRTPITVVRGHLELMGDDPAERADTVALVTDELDRMARIVDDLLLLAKLEAPDPLRLEPVALGPLVEDLHSKASTLATRTWLAAVPPERGVVVEADPQRLTQAVLNLARNAVEHAGPEATITLGARMVPGAVELFVADDGPGIPVEEQEAIFGRFARGGDRRRRTEGAGLGLAISRAIAQAHGGHLRLDSRPGAGARFTLWLPHRPATPDPDPTRTAPTAPGAAGGTDQGDRTWPAS